MTTTIEQFTTATQAHLDAYLDLGHKTFASIEKLFELQLQAARATLSESTEHAKALLAAKDPQQVVALQTAAAQPLVDKALSYGRQVYDITSAAQADVTKLAEAQLADAQAKLVALVDTVVKNAPAGSEGAVALFKSTLSAANSAVETAQKSAKQAVAAAEANLQALVQSTSAGAAAPAAAKAVKKAA